MIDFKRPFERPFERATFKRPHHQRIAAVLEALDGALLKQRRCLFGGGTAIALRYGEYRESVDIDFVVSAREAYRDLRQLVTGEAGIRALFRDGGPGWLETAPVRADQYGIRTQLRVAGAPIKFEIIVEGRIALDAPSRRDALCGIATLAPLDLATTKLLANTDRWNDDGSFNRDIIDLAMMRPTQALLAKAVGKAAEAYGDAVRRDLDKTFLRLQTREGWFERCLAVMAIELPAAVIWQHLRRLRQQSERLSRS